MKESRARKVIMIMVDGLGIPPQGWSHSPIGKYAYDGFVDLLEGHSRAIDTTLGVPGLPQSATGQCALFTGVNASEVMGMHIQGFPGPKLRQVISERNLFSSLLALGKSVQFANAYIRHDLAELAKLRYRSVTTVMVENSLGAVLRREQLQEHAAVYHDLTRETLAPEHMVPTITPTQAAKDLISISRNHDLVLFEYFMTDRAGHKPESGMSAKYIREFSEFICSLASSIPQDTLLVMTSDHGNCEDDQKRTHTSNPVPLLVLGEKPPDYSHINSLLDVHDWIVSVVCQQSR